MKFPFDECRIQTEANGSVYGAIFVLVMFVLCQLAIVPNAWAQGCDNWSTAEIRLLSRSIDASVRVLPDSIFPRDDRDTIVHVFLRSGSPLDLDGHKALDGHGIRLLECLQNCTYIASLNRARWDSFIGADSDVDVTVSDPDGVLVTDESIALERMNSRFDVRLLGRLDAFDKIDLDIQRDRVADWAVFAIPFYPVTMLKVLIGFHRDVSVAEAGEVLEDLENILLSDPRRHGPHTWSTVVNAENIEDIAMVESIRRVELGPRRFMPLNGTARPVTNTDEVQYPDFVVSPPEFRIDGQAATLGICDKGIDESHPDFKKIGALWSFWFPYGPGFLFPYGTRFVTNDGGSSGHGTHVAAIAAGNGFNSDVTGGEPKFHLRGHSPKAQIGAYGHCGHDTDEYYKAVVNYLSDVTNHSYVQSSTDYDDEAGLIDQMIRGDVLWGSGVLISAKPQVWAAGNAGSWDYGDDEEGYYSIASSAKNSISVGSIDTVDGRWTRRSSLGPTLDGRIKPDVVAPGCRNSVTADLSGDGIKSATESSGGSYGYSKMCGTSMAAPVVTGIIGLMIDRFYEEYGQPLKILPSTYKAILVNTAVDQVDTSPYEDPDYFPKNPDTGETVFYHAGPDYATGFGLVDAVAAVNTVAKTNQWKEASIGAWRPLKRWCLYVPKGSGQLKVTLAWDDEPGCTAEPPDESKLSNDLDLRLVSPSGKTILPWTLKPLPLNADPGGGGTDPISPEDVLPAEPGVDRLNNVEMASVAEPEHGIWHLFVDAGYRLCLGTSQPFSLATSHKFLTWCPMIGPICELNPLYCPKTEICGRVPQFCHLVKPIPVKIDDRMWAVDPIGPTPLSEICKHRSGCPRCEGKSWELCPGWEMELSGVPEGLGVILFDGDGQIIDEIDAPEPDEGRRLIRAESMKPGQDFFFGFTDQFGNPYPRRFNSEFDVRLLDSPP